MAVRIRMTRKGRKKRPFYRIVAADRQAPRDGKFIEVLGTFDPMQEPAVTDLKRERILDWLGKGATPSDSVKQILQREGVWKEFHTAGAAEAAAEAMGIKGEERKQFIEQAH